MYVLDHEKAWTSASYNSISLNVEQVGFASTSKKEWIKGYHRGLRKVAETLADWSIKYNIPLEHSTTHGVCQHRHISGPGGHTDCGPGYPETYVTYWARLIRWRKLGRRSAGRRKAVWLKARILAQQVRYAGRVLGT